MFYTDCAWKYFRCFPSQREMYSTKFCATLLNLTVTVNLFFLSISLPPSLPPSPGAWSSARGQLCTKGGTAGRVDTCQTFCLCHWQSWYGQDQDPSVPEPHLPEHETQTHVAWSQSQGRHKWWAVWLHQSCHKRVEGWWDIIVYWELILSTVLLCFCLLRNC